MVEFKEFKEIKEREEEIFFKLRVTAEGVIQVHAQSIDGKLYQHILSITERGILERNQLSSEFIEKSGFKVDAGDRILIEE